jgi:hypothetical protein
MTTMSDVAGGCVCSLLGVLGGISGRKFYIWGIVGCNKPIWDVLVLEGEQEEALNRLGMGSISLGFSIRQAVPLGLAWAQNCCWAHWARFFIEKKLYISKYNKYTSILPISGAQGGWEWMDGFG